jgi:hypothetical protein
MQIDLHGYHPAEIVFVLSLQIHALGLFLDLKSAIHEANGVECDWSSSVNDVDYS